VVLENDSTGSEHYEESHRSVRNVVGWTLVQNTHHGAVLSAGQQTHESINYLLMIDLYL
jgi:hypothetical protein